MALEHVTNHVERAVARLPQQFRGKVNVEAFVAAVCQPGQDLEDALWDLYSERDVNTAVGDQLDDVGGIVGEERQGRDDDTYRRFVRAKISVNKSKGTALDVLTVASLVLDFTFTEADFLLAQSGIAAAALTIDGASVDRELATLLTEKFLRKTVQGGNRIGVRFNPDNANRAKWGTATYESTDVWGGSSS